MASADLMLRLKDFFARQGAYCEACLGDLKTFPNDVEAETLDAILVRHRGHLAGREALDRELNALREEWKIANPTSAQREEIERAGSEAKVLSNQLAARNAEWKKWVDERMLALTSEMAGLRRGRTEIGRYDSSRNTDASFFDEKI